MMKEKDKIIKRPENRVGKRQQMLGLGQRQRTDDTCASLQSLVRCRRRRLVDTWTRHGAEIVNNIDPKTAIMDPWKLVLLLVLFLLLCCDCRKVSTDNRADLFIVALLPDDVSYLPVYRKVGPALRLAVKKVVQLHLLPGYHLHLSYRNSHCSNVHAPNGAVEAYKKDQVHVFLGPSCEFALGKNPSHFLPVKISDVSL